jgi:DNA gyrase subunit A
MKNVLAVQDLEFADSLAEDYLRYAYSVSLGRAIPDWRDGLKPVQRRVLFVAKHEGILHNKPYKKAAKLVGSVLGMVHPHGDTAAYDAVIRLGQGWVMSTPLIDVHGNKGAISGDSHAAMRYVETRLTPLAYEFMRDLNPSTVKWNSTYDNSDVEPDVLPVPLPNVLVNGATGMAVGYATDIPTHNIYDVVKTTKRLVENPDSSVAELLKVLRGPDFPTGGVITNESDLLKMYETGNGVIKLRAKVEHRRVGNRDAVVFTELPHLQSTEKVIEVIAELVREKKIEGIHDVRDETSNQKGGPGNRVELVVLVKQNADATTVEHSLFKKVTQLNSSYKFNLNGVLDGRVQKFNLKQILETFIDFRRGVIRNRTSAELREYRARLHILEGLLKILDPKIMDKVIKVVRGSKTTDIALAALMSDDFGLSRKQGEAVLAMRLGKLTSMGKEELTSEEAGLLEQVANCFDILKDDALVDVMLVNEMDAAAKISKAPTGRQTTLANIAQGVQQDIPAGEGILTLSHSGFVRRVPTDAFNAQKRGGKGKTGTKVKQGDGIRQSVHAENHDKLFLFTDKGRVLQIFAGQIPESTPTKIGVHIRNIIELPDDESVVSMVPVASEDGFLAVATKLGKLKKTKIDEFQNIRKSGIIAVKLNEGDSIVAAAFVCMTDTIVVASLTAQAARFPHSEVRPTSRDTYGVNGMILAEGDEVVALLSIAEDAGHIVSVSSDGQAKKTALVNFPITKSRPTKGVVSMTFAEDAHLAYFGIIGESDDIVTTSNSGKTIRVESDQVATLLRRTRGSRLINLDDDDAVNSVTIIPA